MSIAHVNIVSPLPGQDVRYRGRDWAIGFNRRRRGTLPSRQGTRAISRPQLSSTAPNRAKLQWRVTALVVPPLRVTIPIAELNPTPWPSFRHDRVGETPMTPQNSSVAALTISVAMMRRSDRAVEVMARRAPWILRGMARLAPATGRR
jgi:hypothetical protein